MEAEKIQIYSENIRLDAFLKFCGLVGTGGEAKLLIQEGMVEVNGESCTQRTKKLRPGDRVTAAGEEFLVTGE